MSFKPLFIASVVVLAACASSGAQQAPAKSPGPDKDAAAEVKKPPKEAEADKEEEVLSTAPVLVGLEEMDRIDPGEELAGVLKAFNEKLFFDGAEQLDALMNGAKQGQGLLDYQLQVFAMRAHAHNMMNEPDLAFGMYRRVLSKWTNLNAAASKLKKADPEHGDVRVARAFDAFAEALFYMGERRRGRVEGIEMPNNDVGDAPSEMKRYVEKNLTMWVRRRERAIEAASEEYWRIKDIKPETPARWVVATHSRIGAMYGELAEDLRAVAMPSSWHDKGESGEKGPDGKPLGWEQIRSDHQARMAKLIDPLLQKAKESYQACVEAAGSANVEGAFTKSCKQWLKANP